MGQMTDSFRPPWAVTMWSTEQDIFVELPMTKGGPSYITRYPKSEGGLSAALAVLCRRAPEAPKPSAASPANYTIPPKQPQVKLSKAEERLRSETTEAQREAARVLIAKLGIK